MGPGLGSGSLYRGGALGTSSRVGRKRKHGLKSTEPLKHSTLFQLQGERTAKGERGVRERVPEAGEAECLAPPHHGPETTNQYYQARTEH